MKQHDGCWSLAALLLVPLVLVAVAWAAGWAHV